MAKVVKKIFLTNARKYFLSWVELSEIEIKLLWKAQVLVKNTSVGMDGQLLGKRSEPQIHPRED